MARKKKTKKKSVPPTAQAYVEELTYWDCPKCSRQNIESDYMIEVACTCGNCDEVFVLVEED